MSKAEYSIHDVEEIRASLGNSHLRYEGGSTMTRRRGGTIVEFSNWVNNENGEPDGFVRIPDPDEVRASLIERMRLLSGLGLNREKLAQGLNAVGALLPDQTPVSYLVLPTRSALHDEAVRTRYGGVELPPRIPEVTRDFNFEGIDRGLIQSFQMSFKNLTRTEEPLTVGNIRDWSIARIRNSGSRLGQGYSRARISEGSVKFAKAVLIK